MPRKVSRPFYEKNKCLQVWIPESLYHWFMDYLQKYSYGETTGEEFRIMLYELDKLEKEGITFVNARESRQREHDKFTKNLFGDVPDADLLCLKQNKREIMTERDKEISCGYCKNTQKDLYRACQKLKQERLQIEGKNR